MQRAQPYFSVIIPTFNRPERLKDCLQAISRLNYARDRFEVLVVDDGGKQALESLIASYQDQFGIRLIKQKNKGPAAARNAGAAQARGAFLAFTDDDCRPHPDWLQKLEEYLADVPDQMVGGRTANLLADNPFSTASQQLVTYLYTYYNAGTGETPFFASNNMAMAASHFQTIGGFNTAFPQAAAEDREFCDRWLEQGFQMTYAPDALVYHTHTLTFYGFVRQHFSYGRGALHFHRIRTRRSQKHLTPEPLSFYINLLRFPYEQRRETRSVLYSVLLLISQAANAAGFFWEAFQHHIVRPITGSRAEEAYPGLPGDDAAAK